MSLKNLLSGVNKKLGQGGAEIQSNDKGLPFFRGLDYDLTTSQPTQAELKGILSGILATIEENLDAGEEMTDRQKKDFILTFYRLAFAQESRGTGCFHPSEISTEANLCHRKLYFQKANVRKDVTFVPFTADNKMQRLCDLGTLKHLYVQENLQRRGILIDMETPVRDPSIGIDGKADGEVAFYGSDDLGEFYDEDMILEVKTINEYGFKALRKPKPEHIKQASLYGGVLKYKRICFIYYNKNTSELKIYVAEVDYKYFNDFCETAREIIKLYNSNVRKSRSTEVEKHGADIPMRVCGSMTVQRATDCAYRDFCFKIN